MSYPWFPWYPKDCDTDENVRAMDDREFGFYMRCLNHAWLNGGIPAEVSELARVLGRPRSYALKVWGRVGKCFIQDGERLVNAKQESFRKEQKEHSDRRSAAGVKGASRRWQTHSNANGSAIDLPMAKNSHPEPQPQPYPETTTTASRGTPITAAEWPLSTEAVCSEFTATDTPLMLSIVHAAAQACAEYSLTLTDEILLQAIQEARRQSPKQHNAVLYRSTVPSVIKNWAKEAKRRG